MIAGHLYRNGLHLIIKRFLLNTKTKLTYRRLATLLEKRTIEAFRSEILFRTNEVSPLILETVMRSRKSALVAGSLLSVSLLSGCASTGITEYHDDHSRAWNLTHSVGMTKLKDSAVPRGQIPSAVLDTLDMGIDVWYFMDSQMLNMDFGNAFGLGLIGMLTRPDAQDNRSTIVAWVPKDDVESQDVAHLWLNAQLRDATLEAMETLGLEGGVEFHNEQKGIPFFAETFATKLSGIKKDGTRCEARFEIFPSTVSDLQPIPDFVAKNIQGYRVNAGHDVEYPRVQVGCLGKDGLMQYVEFMTEISKNLPESVFFYARRAKVEDHTVPPMVYDHGKALFFLVEKN
jgi:hypothetical protein